MARRRLPRADSKLIIPKGEKSAPPKAEPETLILPGDDTKPPTDEAERQSWEPTIVLQEGVRDVDASTLAEEHQGMMGVHRDVQEADGAEDWGDGMTVFPQPAHILRGPDGGITSVVPLNEIPGVEFTPEQLEAQAVVADAKPEPVPLNRDQRHKLVSILATRLFNYYGQLPRDYPGYNPFRDGIPDIPAGSPKNAAPIGLDLYPATNAQIYDWIKKFVGARATVVNKRRFGSGVAPGVHDLALRIE